MIRVGTTPSYNIRVTLLSYESKLVKLWEENKMKKYLRPSVVEFGNASELIQGCGGWGLEGVTLDDSDRDYTWLYTSAGGWVCVCTSVKGNDC
jgi:hypothetical protein